MGNKGGLGRRRDRLWVGLRSTPTQSFATHFHTPNTALLAPFSHILSSRHISAGSSLITHVNMYQRRTERTTSSSKRKTSRHLQDRRHALYLPSPKSPRRKRTQRSGSLDREVPLLIRSTILYGCTIYTHTLQPNLPSTTTNWGSAIAPRSLQCG